MNNQAAPSKLNAMLMRWPKGTVAVQHWLREQGIPRQLAEKYRRSNWIERIGQGAYTRTGDKVEVLGGIYALQSELNLPVHVGGKTALELQGYAHFVSAKNLPFVHLFGRPGRPLPTWFRRRQWESKVRFHLVRLFPSKPDLGLTKKVCEQIPTQMSAPERAALELVNLVPKEQSFSEARQLMAGLTTLRPELVQELLEACRSVKAKRLFLFLAEEAGHPWVKELDTSKLDLGRGKRSIVKGGRFDPKYGITVEPNPHGLSGSEDRAEHRHAGRRVSDDDARALQEGARRPRGRGQGADHL